MTARTTLRWTVRIAFALAFIIGLALFLGYAPIWSGVVLFFLIAAGVAVWCHRLET